MDTNMAECLPTVQEKHTTILTGFLGSGKTTYLNHLLKTYPDIRYAIIENEFGRESIDSELILRAEDEVLELNDGCLCCTLNEGLYDILNTLHSKSNDYDQLIVEATGLADPRGLAGPFLTNPTVKKHFPLSSIVCLIDAELIEDQLTETTEAIHQITFSDILLINKTDLVSDQYVKTLTRRLSVLNPLAKIVTGHEGNLPHVAYDQNRLTEDDERINPTCTMNSDHEDHQHSEVVSLTLIFERPFDYQKLHLRLMTYLMFQAKNLYRMKGIVWVTGSEERYVVQSVGKRLAISVAEKGRTAFERRSKIILIGKNLEKSGLIKMFNQCQ